MDFTVNELFGMYDLSKPVDSRQVDKLTKHEYLSGPWTFYFTVPPVVVGSRYRYSKSKCRQKA